MDACATLFDAVKDQQEHFEQVVHSALEKGLIELGSQVYDLEWANLSVRIDEPAAKAA